MPASSQMPTSPRAAGKQPWGRIVAAVAAVALAVTGCGTQAGPAPAAEPTAVRFALDWTPNTNHTGLSVALAQGYFEDAGLAVEVLPYNQALPDQLIDAGQAEFGLSFQSNFTVAKAAGADIVSVMAVLQKWAAAIAVKADSDITRPADLDGRTYAGFGEPAEELMLQRVIQADGGTGEFESVTLGTSAYEALYAGRADFTVAFLAWEGIEAQHRGYPLRYFPYSDYGFPNTYNVIVSGNPGWIAEHPDQARAFVQALVRGYQFAADNPDEAAQILMDVNPGFFNDTEMVVESQRMLSEGYLTDDEGRVGTQTLETWQNYGRVLFDDGLLTGPDGRPLTVEPDWSEYFTDDLIG